MSKKTIKDYSLKVSVAAKLIDKSPRTIRRMLQEGRMDVMFIVVGGVIKIHAEGFKNWVKKQLDIEVDL